MKYRQGFVSNSSSSSYIIKFKSSKSREELASYIQESDEMLKKMWYKDEVKDFDWSKGINFESFNLVKVVPLGEKILTSDDENFELYMDTTMFNDWMDIPAWPFIRALSENRINDVELIEINHTSNQYGELENVKEEFNPYCWEYEYDVVTPAVKIESVTDDMEVIEFVNEQEDKAYKHQQEIEYKYLKYLSTINVPLSEEEVIKLTKQHLSKM